MFVTGQSNRTRQRRRRLLASGLAAVLVFSAASCGSDDDDKGGDGTSPTQSEGKALAINIGSEPGSLDPLLKSDGPRDTFGQSVYEGLTTRQGNADGSTIEPSLASSWELDGTAWIFTLREGVTFHNGQALTAADVVASWTRMLSPESEHLGSKVFEDTVITAVDDLTVSIERPVADPTTPARAALVMIAPADYADVADDRLASEMMGTGPYKFDGWERGKEITLSTYDGYWGAAPSIPSVNVLFGEEVAVRMASLQAGEIQMAMNMSPDLVSDEFVSVGTPVSEVSIMRLNSQSGPFMDKRVREAANLAMDRDALAEAIWGGFATSANAQEVAAYVFGHNPDLEQAAYDPDKARSLLEEADAVGVKVEVWGTRGHWTNDGLLGEAVVGMLNDAGFDAELVMPPFEDWVKKVFVAETDDTQAPDITLYNHSNELFDSSLTIGQNLTCAGRASTTCIPEVDELAEQALNAGSDLAKRQDLYNQVWQILADEVAFVSLGEVQKLTFHVEGLNWTPEADGFLRFQFMSFA